MFKVDNIVTLWTVVVPNHLSVMKRVQYLDMFVGDVYIDYPLILTEELDILNKHESDQLARFGGTTRKQFQRKGKDFSKQMTREEKHIHGHGRKSLNPTTSCHCCPVARQTHPPFVHLSALNLYTHVWLIFNLRAKSPKDK